MNRNIIAHVRRGMERSEWARSGSEIGVKLDWNWMGIGWGLDRDFDGNWFRIGRQLDEWRRAGIAVGGLTKVSEIQCTRCLAQTN